MLLSQARKIRCDGYKPDIVVGIARGGLVPLRILADLLETRDLAVITIEYYVGIAQKSREPILKQCLHTTLTGKKVLLVDDVSDGGRSLQLAKKHLEEQCAQQIKVATIYCKPGTLTTPDYYEKETNRWIVFPWEARETLTKLGRMLRANAPWVGKLQTWCGRASQRLWPIECLKMAVRTLNVASNRRVRRVR